MNHNTRVLVADLLKEERGSRIQIKGWIDSRRDHGQLTFLDIRDHTGLIQCVGSGIPEMKRTPLESVVEVSGVLQERAPENVNSEIATGNLELVLDSSSDFIVLNPATNLPLPVKGDGHDINEETRLKYRYLDLRRPRMNTIMRMRSEFIRHLRNNLYAKDFVEIETPMLTKSTKEGARDFIVPSRFNPGKFYALPQSPQQYKQLLMTAGINRYFQVARCIRDEDLRADRGFEFTQLDLEMSFSDEVEIRSLVEQVVKSAVTAVGGKMRDSDFPVITYAEAVSKYGADKFDLRTPEEKEAGLLAFAWVIDFPFFKRVDKKDTAEVRDSKSGWTFTHNPFSMPKQQHLEQHMAGENVEQILTTQYDLVCNGFEVGGGSIRAHRPEILKQTLTIMGYSETEIQESIGHMLEAFATGTPPHGGIALGLDRLVMLLAGESSLKEAIAFPMTGSGKVAVMEAPAAVTNEQLEELGIKVTLPQIKNGEDMRNAIIQLLKSRDIDFTHMQHEEASAVKDAMRVSGESPESIVKSLILVGKKTGKNVIAILPGSNKLNIKSVEELAGEKLAMEQPEKIQQHYGLQIGGVPPFGNILNLQVFADESILHKALVSFSCGLRTESMSMAGNDLITACEAKTAAICK